MMKAFAVLAVAVAVCASPAMAVYFNSTATGSMYTYLGANGGYGDGGGAGQPKLSQAGNKTQQWGYTSFYGANDGSGTTLKSFVQNNPGAVAKLYVAVSSNLSGQYVLETLRSGNEGAMTQDALGNGYGTYTAPGAVGATEPVAWALGARTSGAGYSRVGDYGSNGIAWITPAGRTAGPKSGATWNVTTPGTAIDYTIGGGANQYGGYENDSKGLFAIADILGVWGGNNGNATATSITQAGQYLNGGNSAPSIISTANIVPSDPKNQTVSGYVWLEITLDSTMLNDIATNTQNKALMFMNAMSTLTANGNATSIYNSAGIKPYLSVTPEPVSLCLLALGSLALLRRRA